MSLRKTVFLMAVAAWFLMADQIFASVVIREYRVCSTSVVNGKDDTGADAPHGLWTNRDYFDRYAGANYFDITATFTEYDDGTAVLEGVAINPYGVEAKIDLQFADYKESLPGGASDYKQEGGLPYSPDVQWYYGEIKGEIVFHLLDATTLTVDINDMVSPPNYHFQVGLGANAKEADQLGASAWIIPAWSDSNSDHWDLNLRLKPIPEPGTMVVWSVLGAIGGLGLAFSKRRMSR